MSSFLWLIGDCQQCLVYRLRNSCIGLTPSISCGWTSHCTLSGMKWLCKILNSIISKRPFYQIRSLRPQHVFGGPLWTGNICHLKTFSQLHLSGVTMISFSFFLMCRSSPSTLFKAGSFLHLAARPLEPWTCPVWTLHLTEEHWG